MHDGRTHNIYIYINNSYTDKYFRQTERILYIHNNNLKAKVQRSKSTKMRKSR